MLMRKAPAVSVYIDEEGLPSDTIFDLTSDEFMVAVNVEHWQTGPKNDSNYIQWVGSYNVQTENSYEEKYVPLHVCTDEDFERFYPVVNSVAKKVK